MSDSYCLNSSGSVTLLMLCVQAARKLPLLFLITTPNLIRFDSANNAAFIFTHPSGGGAHRLGLVGSHLLEPMVL
jgi:hypothetical protein